MSLRNDITEQVKRVDESKVTKQHLDDLAKELRSENVLDDFVKVDEVKEAFEKLTDSF